jgi:hypothetical protein
MDGSLILDNLLSPPILFFLLGLTATLVRSDLDLPQPIPKALSLFLLLAIGFKGGMELRAGGVDMKVALTLLAATVMATLVPLWTYWVLRRRLDVFNAAAIAAAYGSISAVTFITAVAMLQKIGVSYGGHMVAAMALMESPAIVVAVLLVRLALRGQNGGIHWGKLLHEAFLNGSVFLLLGSLLVGIVAAPDAAKTVKPMLDGLFRVVLLAFLLDMGLVAGRQLRSLQKTGTFLGGFAIVVPVINAVCGIGLARLLQLSPGDALLLAVLCASASYIAVPAAVRLAIPEANPGLYVPMALAITFPFNIVIGLPLYWALITAWWG